MKTYDVVVVGAGMLVYIYIYIRSPVAMLICSWRRPSEAAIRARFSRSAVICACIARRISLGGVKSLIS